MSCKSFPFSKVSLVLKTTSRMFKDKLQDKIVENKNICAKNKDLLSLTNDHLIQINKYIQACQLIPEAQLILDNRYKVTFNDSTKDKVYQERVNQLKNKIALIKQFDLEMKEVWDPEMQISHAASSRSGVESSLSFDSAKSQKEKFYNLKMKNSRASKASKNSSKSREKMLRVAQSIHLSKYKKPTSESVYELKSRISGNKTKHSHLGKDFAELLTHGNEPTGGRDAHGNLIPLRYDKHHARLSATYIGKDKEEIRRHQKIH